MSLGTGGVFRNKNHELIYSVFQYPCSQFSGLAGLETTETTELTLIYPF